MSESNAMKLYRSWLESPFFDEETKEELQALAGDPGEIEERFYMELEFGTAGLRGIIGAGTNRMNKYTVRKASQGLANYIIKQNAAKKGVAIAFDSRHFSPEFAREAALTLAANGVKAYLFDALRPTPELSFAVRYLGATAGINVTASHNPAEYNGYKVYWEDGAQITPPHDTGIMAEVRAVDITQTRTMGYGDAVAAGLLQIIGSEVDDAYVASVKAQVKSPEAVAACAADIKIVYTPLHGAGNKLVRRVLGELGFSQVHVVAEQEQPDGAFPTVPYPNPEAPEAFALALELARKVDADLVLATDPDSDRLGVYVKDKAGEYHSLTGNVSGALIGDYEIGRMQDAGKLPGDGRLISTIVSGKLGKAIAEHYGAKYVEVLTGFKYIGEQIRLMEESGEGSYLFGYEESYGCLVGTYARDKDAVVASMALCELAAYCRSLGMNMWDAVVAMYDKYGYYREGVTSLTFKGIEGKKKMDAIMERLYTEEPAQIGAFKVLAKRNYASRERLDMLTGEKSAIDLPVSKVVFYELPDAAWCCVRPSGTEPKIKLYYGVKGSSFEDAERLDGELKEALNTFAGV